MTTLMRKDIESIWKLLWPFIADENSDEDYSEVMAENLCTTVLPQVWSSILLVEQDLTALQAQADRWMRLYKRKRAENIAVITDTDMRFEELRDGIRLALDVINHGDFKNGITGPNGIIDEGEVHASRMAKRLEFLLGGDDANKV